MNITQLKNTEHAVALFEQANSIERTLRVLQSLDGTEATVSVATIDELANAARELLDRAVTIVDINGGDSTYFRTWANKWLATGYPTA